MHLTYTPRYQNQFIYIHLIINLSYKCVCVILTAVLVSDWSHRVFLCLHPIILYEKPLKEKPIGVCPAAIHSWCQVKTPVIRDILTNISPESRRRTASVSNQVSMSLNWRDVKHRECGKVGMELRWRMMNKEWAALKKRRRWEARASLQGRRRRSGRWLGVKEAVGAAGIARSVLSTRCDGTDWHNWARRLPLRRNIRQQMQFCISLDNISHQVVDGRTSEAVLE